MNTQTLLSQLPNFNPRDVPVTGIDTHLPAVPTERLTPDALRQRFYVLAVKQRARITKAEAAEERRVRHGKPARRG